MMNLNNKEDSDEREDADEHEQYDILERGQPVAIY